MTTIRRNIKNVVHNYSDAKVKVREATSNDPWGPSSTLMAEIAEMTYNVMAYTEIMSMIWKRLNDKNKNWRHVYKALVLLDYLVKTGSEKVAQQCKENLFVVQSLRDFQYIEEAKDQGLNVREKAKQLVALLKDDEKLRTERASALRTRERLHGKSPATAASASAPYRRTGSVDYASATSYGGGGGAGGGAGGASAEAEDVELELALAISKEEHAEEQRRREADGLKDDLKLKMALEASKKEEEDRQQVLTRQKSGGGLVDLIDTTLSAAPAGAPDPWGTPAAANGGGDPWSSGSGPHRPVANDSGFSGGGSVASDPWSSSLGTAPQQQQLQQRSSGDFAANDFAAVFSPPSVADPWSSTSTGTAASAAAAAAAPGSGSEAMAASGRGADAASTVEQPPRAKSAQSFLGDHGNLVNLDTLVPAKPKESSSTNPFAPVSHGPSHPSNPFFTGQPSQPTLSELQRQNQLGFGDPAAAAAAAVSLPPPLIQAPPPVSAAASAAYPPSYNPWGPQPQAQMQPQPQPQQQQHQYPAASLNPFM